VSRELHHPQREQLTLAAVLEALSDPVRLEIVRRLHEAGENRCGSFEELASKANLTYHFARLREAGVTQTRLEGPYRYISLRARDLDVRFPGLLDAVLDSARRERGARARRG
jgi:DNA-binding transcriptional ArsR family regulator